MKSPTLWNNDAPVRVKKFALSVRRGTKNSAIPAAKTDTPRMKLGLLCRYLLRIIVYPAKKYNPCAVDVTDKGIRDSPPTR